MGHRGLPSGERQGHPVCGSGNRPTAYLRFSQKMEISLKVRARDGRGALVDGIESDFQRPSPSAQFDHRMMPHDGHDHPVKHSLCRQPSIATVSLAHYAFLRIHPPAALEPRVEKGGISTGSPTRMKKRANAWERCSRYGGIRRRRVPMFFPLWRKKPMGSE